MATRIRIIKKVRKPGFSERLEQRARAISGRREQDDAAVGITSTLERQLGLTLSHIDSVRCVHRDLQRSLLRQELNLDTEIMQREPTDPVYQDPRLKERDMLRDRLRRVEHERRRLALVEEESLRGLHDRLAETLNRCDTLDRSGSSVQPAQVRPLDKDVLEGVRTRELH